MYSQVKPRGKDFKLICSKHFQIINSDLVTAIHNDIKLTL